MYLRLTRNSAVHVGVIGAIVLFPIAILYWSMWFVVMSIVWTAKFIIWFMLLPAKVSDVMDDFAVEHERSRSKKAHPSNHK